MMGLSPRCYITSFVEIGLPVPEKKIFKGFLPYVGMAAILVMGPASCHQFFISLYLKAFMEKLIQIGKVVSEKIRSEFLYVHDLGPSLKMTLTFNTHIPSYIQLDVCSYYVSGHWLQYFLKNSLFSLFPIEKPKFLI